MTAPQTRGSTDRWLAAGGAAFVVMALAQIAIPLTDDPATTEWLSTTVVAAFFATTLAIVLGEWGLRRGAAAAGFVAVATLVVERIGSTTGFPFGDYEYTGALEPTVGSVPVIVPLAWFAMGIPALELGHRIAPAGPFVAVGLGAMALTAWDLFLDPQMVDNGYWVWADDGVYEGIPLSNYAGWLAVGTVVLLVVDRIRPPQPSSVPLLALYSWWAVMNTVGFLVFFDAPLVGVVGGVAMGSLTGLAWWRRG